MGETSIFLGSSEEAGREKSWRDGSIGGVESIDSMRDSFTSSVKVQDTEPFEDGS